MNLDSLDVQTQFLDLIQPSSFEMEAETSIVQRQMSLGSFDVETESHHVSFQDEQAGVSSEFTSEMETVSSPLATRSRESQSWKSSMGDHEMTYEVTSSRTEMTSPISSTSSLIQWNRTEFTAGLEVGLRSEVELQHSNSFASVETHQQRVDFSSVFHASPVSVSGSSSRWSTEFNTFEETSISLPATATDATPPGASRLSQVTRKWNFDLPLNGGTVNYSATQTEWSMPGQDSIDSLSFSSEVSLNHEISIDQTIAEFSFAATPATTSISFERSTVSHEVGIEGETGVTQTEWSQSMTHETTSSHFEFSLGGFSDPQPAVAYQREEMNLSMPNAWQLESSRTSLNLVDDPTMAVCRLDSLESLSNSLELNVSVAPDYSFDLVQQTSATNIGLGIN